MTKTEYMEFHRDCCDRMVEITRQKNADYTGTDASPFANFSRTELNGVCSTEQGFLVRMGDKLARITSFVQTGVLLVKDESVEDTLLDLANYCVLMAGYIREKKNKFLIGENLLAASGVGTVKAKAGSVLYAGVGMEPLREVGSIDADGTVTPSLDTRPGDPL